MPKAFKAKELPTSDDIVDKGAKSLLPHMTGQTCKVKVCPVFFKS